MPRTRSALARLRKRPIDYFKMFYGDTALFGAWHAMESGLAFFGADHVLFGTDMPFDPEKGPGFIRDTIEAMYAHARHRRREGADLRGQRAPATPAAVQIIGETTMTDQASERRKHGRCVSRAPGRPRRRVFLRATPGRTSRR